MLSRKCFIKPELKVQSLTSNGTVYIRFVHRRESGRSRYSVKKFMEINLSLFSQLKPQRSVTTKHVEVVTYVSVQCKGNANTTIYGHYWENHTKRIEKKIRQTMLRHAELCIELHDAFYRLFFIMVVRKGRNM